MFVAGLGENLLCAEDGHIYLLRRSGRRRHLCHPSALRFFPFPQDTDPLLSCCSGPPLCRRAEEGSSGFCPFRGGQRLVVDVGRLPLPQGGITGGVGERPAPGSFYADTRRPRKFRTSGGILFQWASVGYYGRRGAEPGGVGPPVEGTSPRHCPDRPVQRAPALLAAG